MNWANLLHFYQPQGQKREIIDAIVEQCYRPVGEGILAHPEARLTINFTGVLLEQLDQYGHRDVIELYAETVRRGQVELTGSAQYHTILPLLPPDEARRQIEVNDDTGRRYFGDLWQPRGIFLPEMGYAPELAPILAEMGFEWVLLDELAYNGRVGQVDYTKTYQIADTGLGVLFREHRLSAAIMSAAPRDVAALEAAVGPELTSNRYVVTAMDGETFGHHRVGHEQLLFGMFASPKIKMTTMSEIFELFATREAVKPVASTWASNEADLARDMPFVSWRDPDNALHTLQWKLLELVVDEMRRTDKGARGYAELRTQLDWAVSSDQFFWAAAKPWWMIEYIEAGAHALLDVLQRLPHTGAAVVAQGQALYHEIMATAYDWQRTGKIDEMADKRHNQIRIPYRELTCEKGDEATWRAIIDLLKREELEAAGRGDYEAAILWRDGAYKLEHKLDIYDAWYILDIMRTKLPRGEVEATINRYKADFDKIRGGQVEQRSN